MINLILFIDPEAPVTEALALMRRRYVDSLIVSKTADSPEFGIITTIDICDKIVAHSQNPSKIKVKEIMHTPVVMVPETMTVQECASKMKEMRIHHLPVVDEKGGLVGMIAATDFLVVAESFGYGGAERALT
jgi:signal-transduction protein with cAMP-binding, CBS, and nucleotidyltransferase domain